MATHVHELERLGSRLALEHLRAAEWMHTDWGPGICGVCGADPGGGHRTECGVGQAILVLKTLAVLPRDPSMVW